MRSPHFIKYILSLLLFGSNGVWAAAIALSSQEIVFFRLLFGALSLLVIFALTRTKITFHRHRRDFGFLALSGCAQGVLFLFLFKAYQLIGVSLASLAYYCGPVIVMILSPLLFRETLTRGKVLGFLTVLGGVVLVNGQAALDGKSIYGLVCAGLASFMYALLVIATKKNEHIHGLENPTIQLVFSLATVAIYLALTQGFAIQVQPVDWLPLLALGLTNTGLGCYLYYTSIGQLPAQQVALFGYLEPLSSVFYSAFLLHETLAPIQIFGGLLIVGGAFFGELYKGRKPVVP
ncbi:MAG: EamA family transporter [Ruminiclostridium sp.]|nr:EamA family transporter [Ruminiclostridium sp.]